MTADGPLLGQKRILELLTELGRRCAVIGFSVDMLVVGGGAIALAYGEDRSTRDIDAIFEPKMRVYEIASTMADEFELPRDWLNEGVKGLLPDCRRQRATVQGGEWGNSCRRAIPRVSLCHEGHEGHEGRVGQNRRR